MLIETLKKSMKFILNKRSIYLDDSILFQELNYDEYEKNSDLLDEYLSNHYDYNHPIKFFSFRKFYKLPKAFENYKHYINNYFPLFSINKDDVVIDVGAHHGIFTINMAYLGAQVHSFEPNPMSFEILKKNIAVNKFAHVPIINNFAVSNIDHKIVNFDLGVRSTAGSIKNLKNESLRSGEKIEVNTVTIDQYIKDVQLKEIKLLKMDCEGAEYDIFNSSKYIRDIEYLIVEAHEIQDNNPSDLINKLSLNGFEVNKVKANYGAYELYCRKK